MKKLLARGCQMGFGRRTASLFIAICLIISCLFTTPVFAAAADTLSDNNSKIQTDITNSNDEGSDEALTETETEDPDADADEPDGDVPEQAGEDPATTGDEPSSTVEDPESTTVPETDTDKEAPKPAPKDDESLWYSSKIPMKKEHQKLLWDYCKKRNIDYIDMLALISLESNFNEKCSTKKYKGYFQISTSHGPNLSKTLKTANKPLDGAININWGTALYSWTLADKRVKGLEGRKQRDVALSIYQRGSGGYDKYGLSKSFLSKYYKKRDIIVSYFKNESK
jgi:hypothetical protein